MGGLSSIFGGGPKMSSVVPDVSNQQQIYNKQTEMNSDEADSLTKENKAKLRAMIGRTSGESKTKYQAKSSTIGGQ